MSHDLQKAYSDFVSQALALSRDPVLVNVQGYHPHEDILGSIDLLAACGQGSSGVAYLAMSADDVGRAEDSVTRRGAWAVFVGRLVPAVRTLISIPAGMFAMPSPKFMFWSFVGSLLWSGVFAGLGFALGERF